MEADERALFRTLLVRLARSAEAERSTLESNDRRLRHCFDLMRLSGFRPADSRALDKFIGDRELRGDTTERPEFVFLPPPPKNDRLSMLSVDWNFEQDPDVVRFQVATFIVGGQTDPESQAYGYRFETPHRRSDDHNYFHAQPIARFERASNGALNLPRRPTWVPTAVPTFPLDAADTLGLFACVLLSVYGRRVAREHIHRAVKREMDPTLRSMRTLV